MGADNWTICPRCAKKVEAEHENLQLRVKESYGKIPADEYLNLVKDSKKEIEYKPTLREDYWQGMRDGLYSVSYSCSCDCGFTFEFKHEEQAKI